MEIRYSEKKKIFNIHTDDIPYLSVAMLDGLGVPNLYSTRYVTYDAAGSEKNDPKDSGRGLRVVVMKDEDFDEAAPEVLKNRDRLAHLLGSSIDHECITDQKHTANVIVAHPEDLGPVWPSKKPDHMRNVDGIVTDIPEVLLTVFGADCPPVYLADPVRHAVGLVHAGWRGTFERIPAVAIGLMKERFGCDPKDIYAAVGPGICRDCYEMGDEVYEAFAEKWGQEDADRIFGRYPAMDPEGKEIPEGKYHLDLFEANHMTLMREGVPEEHIALSNVCTRCNADIFYSYRAHRMENEQAAMIVNRFL